MPPNVLLLSKIVNIRRFRVGTVVTILVPSNASRTDGTDGKRWFLNSLFEDCDAKSERVESQFNSKASYEQLALEQSRFRRPRLR